MNSKEFKKASGELDRILGIPPSTFARDCLLLLLSAACTFATYTFYESGPPATPGRFIPPVHKPGLLVMLFLLSAASMVSGTWVLKKGWVVWQRQVALVLLIFPSMFVFAMLVWAVRRLF